MRPTGICAAQASSRPAIIGVRMARGTTTLAVTPRWAYSFDSALARMITPPFEAA